MSNEKDLKERLELVKRKLGIMEWDKNKNQFNPGKAGLYEDLKKEQESIEQQLSQSSDNPVVEQKAPEILNEE